MTTWPRNNRIRRGLNHFRWLLGIGLLAWVFSRLPMDEFQSVWRDSVEQWHWWLSGVLMTGMGLLAACIRWSGLLAAQSVQLPPGRVFRIFFIGQFFNSFLPGAAGGDAARAYYVFKETRLKRTEAVATIVVDRGIGLLTLMIFACIMMAWRLPVFWGALWAKSVAVILGAVAAIGIVVLYLAFRRDLLAKPSAWQTRSFAGHIVTRIYHAFFVYRNHPRVVARSVLLSLINLCGLTLACFAFGQSLSLDVALIDYFTLFPVITVLSAIPLTPGALGVRESLFAELFTLTGARVAYTVPLSLLVYAGGLFWSLFGGILFIRYSASFGISIRDEWERLQIEFRRLDQAPLTSPSHAGEETEKADEQTGNQTPATPDQTAQRRHENGGDQQQR